MRGLVDRGFRASPDFEAVRRHMATHREALDYGIRLVYWDSSFPHAPVIDGILAKTERQNQLRKAITAAWQ